MHFKRDAAAFDLLTIRPGKFSLVIPDGLAVGGGPLAFAVLAVEPDLHVDSWIFILLCSGGPIERFQFVVHPVVFDAPDFGLFSIWKCLVHVDSYEPNKVVGSICHLSSLSQFMINQSH